MTDRFVEEKDAAEARVRELERLVCVIDAAAGCASDCLTTDTLEYEEAVEKALAELDRIPPLENDRLYVELAALEAENAGLRETIEAKDAELAEAKKDTARMDWIDENVLSLPMSANNSDDIEWAVIGQLRVAIDDARKAD